MNHNILAIKIGPRPARRAAFTLIELLLVLVILAILMTLVVVNFAGKSEKARNTAAGVDVKSMGIALDAFNVDNGRYPTNDEGLTALITPIAGARDTTSWPYLKQDAIPNDPWGSPYQYRFPGQMNKNGYDLFSMGADKNEGGGDDVGNWSVKK